MSFKKLVGKIHLWLGLTSGFVVLVLSISGCLYVFVDEIKPIVYKDRLQIEVPANTKKIPLSILKQKAQNALGNKYPFNRMLIPAQPNRTYEFISMKAEEEKSLTYFGSLRYHYTIFVNPYSGEIVKIENSKYEFFRIVFWIHWSLLLSTELGQPIVGGAVIIFVLLLITGLILWWPKNKNAIRQRFWFKWKKSTKWKRKNYDMHNVPGFYNLLLALVISLTGLVWAFDWFKNSVKWIADTGKTIEKPKPVFSDTTQMTSVLSIDTVFYKEKNSHPNACSYSINFPIGNKSVVNINTRLNKHSYYESINSQYDQYTGKLIKTSRFSEKSTGEKIYALNYDIHVGGALGLPGKILAFFASFICGSLPVTGFFIWWGRKKKQKQKINQL